MNICPCCSGVLLRQVRKAGIYWFCLDCRQEMPVLKLAQIHPQSRISRSILHPSTHSNQE